MSNDEHFQPKGNCSSNYKVAAREDTRVAVTCGLIVGFAAGEMLGAWLTSAYGASSEHGETVSAELFDWRGALSAALVLPIAELPPEDSPDERHLARVARSAAGVLVFSRHYAERVPARLGVDPESGRILFQSRNIDRARIYGAEFDAAVSLEPWMRGLELRAAAFWARGDNREADEPLNSVGPAQAVIAGSWTSPSGRTEATLAGTFTRRHSRLDESGGELFEAPGYGTADLFLTQRAIVNADIVH